MTATDDSWVLVTGASGGFGEEFARQYAEQGLSLVLVARRLDRLQALAEALRQQYRIDVVVEQVDLSDVEAVTQMHQRLRERGIAIDIVINNAGHGLQGGALPGRVGHRVRDSGATEDHARAEADDDATVTRGTRRYPRIAERTHQRRGRVGEQGRPHLYLGHATPAAPGHFLPRHERMSDVRRLDRRLTSSGSARALPSATSSSTVIEFRCCNDSLSVQLKVGMQ